MDRQQGHNAAESGVVVTPPDRPLKVCVAELRSRAGTVLLDNADLLLLAYDEISRTTTYEELAYTTKIPCTT